MKRCDGSAGTGAQPRAGGPDAHTLRLTRDDPSRRTRTPSARSESRTGAIEYGPPADDGIEAHPRRRPSSGIAVALRRICASMRAHGLARPSKRCTFSSLPGIDATRRPQAFPESDASFSSFPRAHEGPWVSATRERVVPCACLAVSTRPHGHRPPGPWVDPRAGLPVAMRPDGCPRSRDGYILHATWLRPSALWMSASPGGMYPSGDRGHRSCLLGIPITPYGCSPPREGVTDRP